MLRFDNRIRQLPYFELQRQIRIERSLALSAFLRDMLRTFARGVRILAFRGVWLVRSLAAERSRRRAISDLQRFADRNLADMGLTRGEIESAVRNGCPGTRGTSRENSAGSALLRKSGCLIDRPI